MRARAAIYIYAAVTYDPSSLQVAMEKQKMNTEQLYKDILDTEKEKKEP